MSKEIIAGVDEAGRGPLAGPVIAAAVILKKNHGIKGLRDSKKLSEKKRKILYCEIIKKAESVGIGSVDVKTIDQINIREATFKAMEISLGRLSIKPEMALIDGFSLKNQIIPNKGIVGGDDIIDSIMAASIIAKVTRDNLMMEYAIIFPEYGFEGNKGYGTKAHIKALKNYRATPIHRRSYRPVKNFMPTLTWIIDNNRLDWLGQKLAALYLKNNNVKIIDINKDIPPFGRISLIGKRKNEMFFIFVKTYNNKNLSDFELDIIHRNIKHMESSIFQLYNQIEEKYELRIDSIIVNLKNSGPEIKFYEKINLNN